jgi:hypothetical protein
MTNEMKCWCKNCKTELEPSHVGPCPKCGKTGKNCIVTISETIVVKSSVSATHIPKPSGNSLTILVGLITMITALVISILFITLPFRPVYNVLIAIGVIIALLVIYWWQRYYVIKLVRWIEARIGGQKTFKGK